MNDEIKDILRDLEFASGVFDYTITPDRCTFLKDYITNLQQENQDLSKMCELYGKSLYNAELTDYKSRCEKANKKLINSKEYQMAIAMELNAKQSILIKLDNILNGRSDE